MRKSVLVCLLILLLVPIWSLAWADFYVIAAGKRAKRTILVSPQTTEAASGTALLNALNSITDNSAEKPYLIKIEPGIYDVGIASFNMKQYVDVEGSGENVTIIRGTVDSTFVVGGVGVVNGAGFSEIRFLEVRNIRPDGSAIAIYNANTVAFRMTHISAVSDGSGSGYRFAIFNNHANAVMTDVRASALNGVYNYGIKNVSVSSPEIHSSDIYAYGGLGSLVYGIYNDDSKPTIYNTKVLADGLNSCFGIYNAGDNNLVEVHGSLIYGKNYSVYNNTSYSNLFGTSKLWKSGGKDGIIGIGTFLCSQCYDGNYKELDGLCKSPP